MKALLDEGEKLTSRHQESGGELEKVRIRRDDGSC